MLPGFEEFTEDLTSYEKDTLVPMFVSAFQKRIGSTNAITNKEIVERLSSKGYILTEPRVRKVISYIRSHCLVNGLVANSRGYYISNDPEEVRRYIDSLEGRESKIRFVKIMMQKHLQSITKKEHV